MLLFLCGSSFATDAIGQTDAADDRNSTATYMFDDCMVDAAIRRTVQLERLP